MFHKSRIWTVAEVVGPPSPVMSLPEREARRLAEILADHTWCCCNGWRCQGYLFLNDSTGADGAQKYAVVREADSMQVERLTVSWMTREECLKAIEEIFASGRVNPVPQTGPVATATSIAALGQALETSLAQGTKVEVHIDTQRPHRCYHCA